MLIADTNGIRIPFRRSKRRSTSAALFPTGSTRHTGTVILAEAARLSATPSHKTISALSSLCGNLAIASCPSPSRTDALGLAPPSDEPGAMSRRRSSSSSLSPITRSVAVSSRSKSTMGGIRNFPGSARNGPSCRSANRKAPAHLIIDQHEEMDFEQGSGRALFAVRRFPLEAPHQSASPSVWRGIADCTEHRPIGAGMVGARGKHKRGLKREPVSSREPTGIIFKRSAFASLADAGPQSAYQYGAGLKVHVNEGLALHRLALGPAASIGGRLADALRKAFFFKL